MKKHCASCLLFATASLSANIPALEEPTRDTQQILPAVSTPEITRPIQTATYLIEGLILVPGGVPLDNIKREHGIHLELKEKEPELKEHLRSYLNHPLTPEILNAIKQDVISYYRKKGRYVAVVIPVQQVEDEVLIMQIFQGILDQVQYIGQRYFNTGALARGCTLKPGDPITENSILDYVTWMNRNPFHQMQVILSPGSIPGTSSVEFLSKERYIIRPFLGSDNTGYKLNNQARFYGGFSCGNMFYLGDIFAFQYTASPNFHTFQSFLASYTSFLSWHHQLNVFACYGVVYPNVTGFSVEGKNVQISARYQIPFRPLYGNFRSSATAGFDWKYITSAYFFVGNAAEAGVTPNQTINLTQFYAEYELLQKWPTDALTFKVNGYASLWKNWLPFQTTFDYNLQRPGSHVRYAYLQASIDNRYQFENGWVCHGVFRGQLASNTLPTSEQFGLGGADTVRGYYEQQFVADNAICANLELYTPNYSLFASLPNELSFLAFFDYGWGQNYSYVSPQFHWQQLMGIGSGVHYSIIPYMAAKLEYGFQLRGIPQDHELGRFHLSLNISY